MALRSFSALLLVGEAIIAHFALGKQAEWSGLFKLDDVLLYQNRILPNTKIPIRLPLTGIAAVDNYFAFMVAFFWGTLDPRNVRAHLHGNYLVGTLGSIWILMLIEAHRSRRSKSFLVITYILEFFGELLGIGMFTPIWCIFHLFWTSRPNGKSDVAAPNKGLGALGYAILVGHVAPTYMMITCKPDAEGLASQQLWSIIRLFHPALVLVSWVVFAGVQSTFFGNTPTNAATEERSVSSVRKFYLLSILVSGFFHASSMGVLLGKYLIPGWLQTEVSAALDFNTFVVPGPFWASASSYSLANPVPFATGVAIFLQWDNFCAASAIVIWSTSLYLEASAHGRRKFSGKVNTLLQSLLVGTLAGPGAFAAYLLMERDAEVLATTAGMEKKRK